MANTSIRSLAKELNELKSSTNLSLAIAFKDEDIRNVRALIVGPPDTPYEFGLFEFAIKVDDSYPTSPPQVKALTTSGGTIRFNPNIYANGKVCLSILGTWEGEPGEQWSPAQGIESILISIQSLMSANPYSNEPGFEESPELGDVSDEVEAYTCKVHHETIRVSILQRLEEYFEIHDGSVQPERRRRKRSAFKAFNEFSKPMQNQLQRLESEDQVSVRAWEPFSDLCKRLFLWYYHSYHDSIDQMVKKGKVVADGEQFFEEIFETSENRMRGTFNYPKLKARLQMVREAIENETESWIQKGAIIQQRDSPAAFTLQNQFKTIVAQYKDRDSPVEFELVKKNPFHWRITLFGRPMTNLEGGIFNIHMIISSTFPEEQPRAKMELPLFHHRVAPDGVICYQAQRPADIATHVEAIIHAIEDDSIGFNPMERVNPEASRLLFGGAESKKIYNRRLRRSAQATAE